MDENRLARFTDRMNRSFDPADSANATQLSACLCVVTLPQQRTAVVGNSNSAPPTREPGQPVGENLSGSNGSEPRINPSLKTERHGKASEHPVSPCGAMSQQGGEFRGNVSAPQKFVHLVGCRDRKVGPGVEARQYSNPLKR
jgi:hypothetical protein